MPHANHPGYATITESNRQVIFGATILRQSYRLIQVMDVDAIVSEAVQEAVQAASQIELCAGEMVDHRAQPIDVCHIHSVHQAESLMKRMDVSTDKENLQHAQISATGHGSNLEVPGQPTASIRLHKAKIRVLACKSYQS